MATDRDLGPVETRRERLAMRFSTWIRRPGAWIEILAWAGLVAFVVWTLGPALIGHATFLNTGLLSRYTPWAETFGGSVDSTNLYTSDPIDSNAPQTSLLVRLAHAGVFGAWDPYVAGGTALGGVPDSGQWSPLSLPWWILPLSYAPGAVKFLEIVAITVGMSLLLRRWGVPRAGWAIASLVYASSGFMVAWSNWPQTRVAAIIPLLFWSIDRAAVELRKRDLLSVGGTVAAMLLGGFPAVVGYALFFGGVFFLARTIVAHRSWRPVLRSAGIAVGGIVVGVLLAAWQLVPFAINAASVVDFSGRSQHGPNGLGAFPLVTSWVPDISFAQASGASWGTRNPVEEYSYIGVASLVLIAAAVLIRPAFRVGTGDTADRNRSRRTVGVVAIVAALLAFSVVVVYLGGPVLTVIRELPVFNSNPIGRARSVVLFIAAALAGVGFGRLVEAENLRHEITRFRAASPLRRTGRLAAIAVVLFVAAGAAVFTKNALHVVPKQYVHQTKLELMHVGILGAVTVVAVLVVWLFRSRIVVFVAAGVVAAIVAVPAIVATKPWWPLASTSTFYPDAPAIDYLRDHVSDQDRYTTTGNATLLGAASYFRIRSITGHTFQTAQWKQLMKAVDPDTYPTPTYLTLEPNLMPELAESSILDRLATKYMIADPSAPLAGVATPAPTRTTWTDLTEQRHSVDSASNTGPLNGITFTGPPATTTAPHGMHLTVSVIADGSGKTLASTASWVPGLGGPRNVALQGSHIPESTSWHLRIRVTGQVSVVPIGTDAAGKAVVGITRPVSRDGVSVVHTGDATIYERSAALPRVRWASKDVVETTTDGTIERLEDRSLPDDTVVMDKTPSHRADPASTATIALQPSDVDSTVAHVDATGGGWVVVADSLQRKGWTATVDGRTTDMVRADSVGAAVWVPAGTHTVRLQYRTPGLGTGIALTAATVLVSAAVCTGVLLVRRRRRRQAPDRG
ncbi:YfhO family protein [Curtobacterium sp. ISL-83]|uniref:YfhO family protein n=1 Tax=Curtobacterium sp. ISL-83 TaxID=2819145 RepID=UPI001BE5583C|nr:YfhO family protein [Curtobacterium sp. ISL-83]MBT2503079.1 YfhO family protein [Curtobacterium sp. ISL-83]